MNTVTGVISCNKIRKMQMIDKISASKFDLTLRDDLVWDVGIDQSSSCTGLCFQDTEKQFTILIDLKRDQALTKDAFYRDLFYLLKRTLEEMKVRLLIFEKPAPKDMYASRVLYELKGKIEEWVKMIPELEGATVDSVFPQTWKKYVVDKSKGKGRTTQKSAVAEDLVDMFPALREYYELHASKDYDAFDACGILNGFLKYAFDENGNEYIHGTVEKTHVAVVGYVWKDRDQLSQQSPLGDFDLVLKPKFMLMNPDKNLFDNIRMASSNYNCVLTMIPQKYLSPFRWEYEIDIDDPNKVLLMYVLRKSEFTNGELTAFCREVPWNKEIYGKNV